jgi:hypothetical protein
MTVSKILQQYLPNDIIKYVITPYLMISEKECKYNMSKNIKIIQHVYFHAVVEDDVIIIRYPKIKELPNTPRNLMSVYKALWISHSLAVYDDLGMLFDRPIPQ